MDIGQLSELEKFNISWIILDLPSLPILDSVTGNDVALSLNNSLRFLDSPQKVGRHGITKQTSVWIFHQTISPSNNPPVCDLGVC